MIIIDLFSVHVTPLNAKVWAMSTKWTCQVCLKSFSSKSKHLLSHTRVKRHNCEQCDKSFAHAQTLKCHMITHNGEKYHHCELCNKSFGLPVTLKTSSLTLGRGSTSVHNATIHLTKQEISDNICSFTVAKRASLVPNAANLSIGLQDLRSTCSSILGRRHTSAHSACFQRIKRVVFRNTFQLIIGKSHLSAVNANSPLIRKRFWTATKWPTEGRVNRNVLNAIFQQTQKVAFRDTSILAIYCGRQAKNRDGSY